MKTSHFLFVIFALISIANAQNDELYYLRKDSSMVEIIDFSRPQEYCENHWLFTTSNYSPHQCNVKNGALEIYNKYLTLIYYVQYVDGKALKIQTFDDFGALNDEEFFFPKDSVRFHKSYSNGKLEFETYENNKADSVRTTEWNSDGKTEIIYKGNIEIRKKWNEKGDYAEGWITEYDGESRLFCVIGPKWIRKIQIDCYNNQLGEWIINNE